MRIAIVGFGREGKAIFDFLKKMPRYRKAEITVLDKNGDLTLPKGIAAQCGEHYLADLHRFDVVFRSPGVPYMLPEIQHAAASGVKISSATKLFFEHAKGKVIGVTGTKGKGTVSTLLYQMLKVDQRDAHLVGNIGTPALELLPKLTNNSITVFELSSFQLHDLETSPDVAIVLDIFPDHMDSHGSFNEYVDAKANIAKHQRARDMVFYSAYNAYSRHIAKQSRGKKIPVDAARFMLFKPADLRIPGAHNFKNAAMASIVALTLGVPKYLVVRAAKKFAGLPHRLEFVRGIKIKNDGEIKFYNDSGGTNPHTAAAAVRAFTEPLFLIAGGKDKNLDYAPLAQAVRESPNLKAIMLIGENKAKIREQLQHGTWDMGHGTKIFDCKTLERAIRAAYEIASNIKPPTSNCIVVFSPGAASFDMFRDYAERGEKFREIVRAL